MTLRPPHIFALLFLACSSTEDGSDASNSASATDAPFCDDDPACGPNEDVHTCPEQCNICSDGFKFGAEGCDNGEANQTYWANTRPDDACSEACDKTFRTCGDGTADPEETCDDLAGNHPNSYSPMLLPKTCGPGCVFVRYCGDGTADPEEGCDNGSNNQTYWSAPPPTGACSNNCKESDVEWCGDSFKNGPEACDNGPDNQTYWPAPPPAGACSNNCKESDIEWCGDQIKNGPEACDGDNCSADCKYTERRVFVTSTVYQGALDPTQNNPQNLSGLALADARCQTLAESAGLPNNYKVWLSDSTGSPSTRFDTTFTGHYRLLSPGHPIVATSWMGLTTEDLQHPLDADETGALSSEEIVWTNTLADGSPASELHCTNWSSNNGTSSVGYSSGTDVTWTNVGPGQLCAGERRLYCFEDPA